MHVLFSENDTIYWVDMGLSTISRAKRDQTWREDVVTNGIGRVEGITVDWIAGLVTLLLKSHLDAMLLQSTTADLGHFFCPRKYLLD